MLGADMRVLASSPHGLAIDEKRGLAYIAGDNGKVAALDLMTGKVTSSVDISLGVDQIAYDLGFLAEK